MIIENLTNRGWVLVSVSDKMDYVFKKDKITIKIKNFPKSHLMMISDVLYEISSIHFYCRYPSKHTTIIVEQKGWVSRLLKEKPLIYEELVFLFRNFKKYVENLNKITTTNIM